MSQFIPTALAIELKNLGYDEKCFGYIKNIGNNPNNETVGILSESSKSQLEDSGYLFIKKPLWQEAFDWFREKHNLHVELQHGNSIWTLWYFNIVKKGETFIFYCGAQNRNYYNSYEEAREAVLEKLISTVKSNKE